MSQRGKKNQKNYAAERIRQSSPVGAVYTHSISEQNIFFFPKEKRFGFFLIIYLKKLHPSHKNVVLNLGYCQGA